MGNSVGRIDLDLNVNQKQFNKQLNGISGLAKKAGVAIAGAFAVKKLIDFGKQAISLGSDLAEVQNVVDVVFPSMTKSIDNFSKNAIYQFGLSETMAKQFTGTYGAMAKAFGFTEQQAYDMSTTLTGLAGDVASFYNIAQNEAYTKLKSVFSGETETLKDLGIVMTQTALDAYAMANGYGKATSKMSEAEKVALRYAFVQEQLASATGDFARTSDSWANQTRILKLQFDSLSASIGQGLINLFTPILRVINSVIAKVAQLASAFKAFTELITGKKATSGTTDLSSTISDLGDSTSAASDGLDGIGSAASGAGDSATSAANKAKNAAKAIGAIGIDELNTLSKEEDSGSGSGSGGTGGGTGDMDFGSLAEGDTVIDTTGAKLQGLIDKAKELANLFKTGYVIGFGDSQTRIDSIKNSLASIKDSVMDIVTDQKVVGSFNNLLDSWALNAGKVAGSFASIGITIADNLIGGIAQYLNGSKDYIKNRLVGIFDARAEVAAIAGDFAVAFADVFSVFANSDAKTITASIVGIFSDSFLGAWEICEKFGRDVLAVLLGPFIDNKNAIKLALENMLKPVAKVAKAIHDSVKQIWEKFNKMYDEHIKPMFDSFREGFSEIVASLLDGYNTHIAPVLDSLSEKFVVMWQQHIQPAVEKFIDFIGKLADSVTTLWEEVIQPFINWIAENIMPVLAPIMETLGTVFTTVFGTIGDVIGDVFDAFSGLLDFIVGIFTGDWEKAWTGLSDFFMGIWNAIVDFLGGIWEAVKKIFEPVISFFKNKFNNALISIKNIFSSIGAWFNARYTDIKNVFANIGAWFSEKFTGAYAKVKNAFSSIGNWFSEKYTAIKTVFSNIGAWFSEKFTGAYTKVKDAFSGIGSYFGGLWDTIKSKFTDIGQKVGDAIGGAFRTAINSVLSTAENILNTPINAINGLLNTINKVPGINLGKLSALNLPRLAQGGYVKANTPQLAMIGDNMHQGEVVAPENKMIDMINTALKMQKESENGGTSTEFQNTLLELMKEIISLLRALDLEVYLDGKKLDDSIKSAQKRKGFLF